MQLTRLTIFTIFTKFQPTNMGNEFPQDYSIKAKGDFQIRIFRADLKDSPARMSTHRYA